MNFEQSNLENKNEKKEVEESLENKKAEIRNKIKEL